MAAVIILGIFIVVLTIASIASINEDGTCVFLIFDAIFIIVLLLFIFGNDSPKNSATNEIIASKEVKLANIETEDGDLCYVLRDSEGRYYFITEVEDQFGKGHSAYEECGIDGKNVIIVEEETNTNDAYVRIDEFNARVTIETLGIKPVYSYTFVVPKGTIKFVKEIP